MTRSKKKGILLQLLAYALAILAAYICIDFISSDSLILQFFIGTFVATLVIFGFSKFYNNSSFYDPYWSVQPMVISVALVIMSAESLQPRLLIMCILASIYAIRLTGNFLRSWKGIGQQDWRYDDLSEKHGKAYWWVSFSGIHMLPTILVFAGCLPFFVAMTDTSSVNALDIIAMIITLGAVLIETISDEQLYRFKKTNPPKGVTFQQGLWHKMRYPNYAGEITFWWSLFLFALAADFSFWWTGIGAFAITILFVFISIPMKDKRMLERRSDYALYKKNTPALFPRLF